MTKRDAPSAPGIWHVSVAGDDGNEGTPDRPLRTIQCAADRAFPGDTIRIHSGIYRERIDPPRGGTSDDCRIVYEAAGDGPVAIKGSEVVEDWKPGPDGIWRADVPHARFGGFNPYREVISGHWFRGRGRDHHPGAVYLDGHWLAEAASFAELCDAPADALLWHACVDQESTKLCARFGGRDPRRALVEINVRQTVFYPSVEGRNFITVRGLELLHAATPWSPPTTEQIGLIGCHWSRGWIIENCTVRYSVCGGITLGKYQDPEDFPDVPLAPGSSGADVYHGTIRRALAHGWSLSGVGGHIVRNNTISHCEMAGICGSLGALRSQISGNIIHDIHVRRLFTGDEQAGIKLHGAIDSEIVGNRIFRSDRGIWLDWMSQGARVSANVCHDNGPGSDLFTEVNHGPFVVDGNFFLSRVSLRSQSDGGAYVGNVFLGRIEALPEPHRATPYFAAHSTAIAGVKTIEVGDDRFLGNVFADPGGAAGYDVATQPVRFGGNVHLPGAARSRHEPEAESAGKVKLSIAERPGGRLVLVGWTLPLHIEVSGRDLGLAAVSGQPFENPDGTELRIAVDLGGPGENGELEIWPPRTI